MSVRRRSLSAGWYPETAFDARKVLDRWREESEQSDRNCLSGIVPHAGWDFSGALAFSVIRRLFNNVDTIVVVGGHLAPQDRILTARENGFNTPLGDIEADGELLSALEKTIELQEDTHADNTVEIQLPIVKYLFPQVRVLCLRVSPTYIALELGKILYDTANQLNKKVCVLGSTDLTHYGPSYGFTPAGRGAEAIEWVKNTNDRLFIEAFEKLQIAEGLAHGVKNSAACSAGAAATAAAFAACAGSTSGQLVGYRMSCDFHSASSFVGYAGIVYAM